MGITHLGNQLGELALVENSSEGNLRGESNLSALTQVGRGGVVPLDHKKKGIRQREGEENYGRKLGEEVDLINEKGTRMGWGEGDFQG